MTMATGLEITKCSGARLSQELIDQIASYLDRYAEASSHSKKPASNLPAYACISRKWQLSIERRTFKSLIINNTELPDLAKIVVGHRRHFLVQMNYDIFLTVNSDRSSNPKFESDEDQKVNNATFTQAFKDLFQQLKSWETDNEGRQIQVRPLTLCLRKLQTLHVNHHDNEQTLRTADEDEDFDSSDSEPEGGCPCCGERQYKDSILRLMSPQDLPVLQQVSVFIAYNLPFKPSRTVEPRSMAALLTKFPNLEALYFMVDDNEVTDLHVAQTLRHEFAQALLSVSVAPKTLRGIQLELHHESPSNQDDIPRNILLLSRPTDHLSVSLRKLSCQPFLTHLSLNGPILISPSLFWPCDTTETLSSTNLPFWPNLLHLGVYLNLATPSGSWYFERNPAEPVQDASMDIFGRSYRTYPNDETITPLLIAMGRAAGRMPALKHMSVVAPKTMPRMIITFGPPSAVFYFDFYGEGFTKRATFEKPGNEQGPRVVFTVTGNWRPAAEVETVWRKARGRGIGWKFIDRNC